MYALTLLCLITADPYASQFVQIEQQSCRLGKCGVGSCSGTIVGTSATHSLVLTAAHCVADGQQCAVVIGSVKHVGTVLRRDGTNDVALVQFARPNSLGLPIETSRQVQVGERLQLHAFPGGGGYTSREVIAIGVNDTTIFTAPAFVSGESGGCLVRDNRVVGVVSGTTIKTGRGVATHWPAIIALTAGIITHTPTRPSETPSVPFPLEPKQPTPFDRDDVLRGFRRIEDRLAKIEAQKPVPGPVGPPGQDGRDGKDGRDGMDAGGLTGPEQPTERGVIGTIQRGLQVATIIGGIGSGAGAVGVALSLFALWRTMRSHRVSQVPPMATPVVFQHPQRAQQPVVMQVDSPPPPQAVYTETKWAPVERDTYAEASAWASQQIVQKYPGAAGTMETHQSLVKQFLASKGVASGQK